MKQSEKLPAGSQRQYLDYGRLLQILAGGWHWIAGFVFLSLLIARLYLVFSTKTYSTTASLKFTEDRSELSALLRAAAPSYDRTNKVQAESFVIQSSRVLRRAIESLNYPVSFYLKGHLRSTDLYPFRPFQVELLYFDPVTFYPGAFVVSKGDSQKFHISYPDGGEQTLDLDCRYGDTIYVRGLKFRIRSYSGSNGALYSFKINRKEDLLQRVASGLSVREAAKSSNVMLLTQTDRNPRFARDILNGVINQYEHFDRSEKSQSAAQTIAFIQKQLSFLQTQVRHSGSALAAFKKKNSLLDPSAAEQQYVGQLSDFSSRKNSLTMEQLEIRQIEEHMNDRKLTKRGLLVGEDVQTTRLVGLLQALRSDREKLLDQFKTDARPVQVMDTEISELEEAISAIVRQRDVRNQMLVSYTDGQLTELRKDLASLPEAEKEFLGLQADFAINQKVFSYLSEKQLEAQISKAAVTPAARVVESAHDAALVGPLPVSIYTRAVMIGIAAGLGMIFLLRHLNPFIYHRETIERLTAVPVIGIIRRFSTAGPPGNDLIGWEKPRSLFTESVRSVRTNLSFLVAGNAGKVICITSEVAGEGKSFVSANLARSFALTGKRTLLVAGDLRRSSLHRTFGASNDVGLSSYLEGGHGLQEILQETSYSNLDLITSGLSPDNPAELLQGARMQLLLGQLRDQYDVILLDTAPVGLVSDSIPLIRTADINVFVIRAGVSHLDAAKVPERFNSEYELTNTVILLNAFHANLLHGHCYEAGNDLRSGKCFYFADHSGRSGYYRRHGEEYLSDHPKVSWRQKFRISAESFRS